MTTTFPSLPIRSYRIDLNENKAITESQFTRQRQVVSLGAGTSDRWEGLVTTRRLKAAQIRTMMNFLVKTGLYGRFTMPYPDYAGAASGATLGAVLGAAQSGTSLIVDGVANSTLIVSEGEYFQVRDEFKRVAADATSNGSGQVTITFKPALRVSPANDDPVVFSTPKLLCELTSTPSEEVDFQRLAPFTISFQEALISV
jgi:hypothetical protein